MDNRLVLTFLFVMLAGGFMGTYAQNTTASSNITAAPTTNVAANSANVTAAPATNVAATSGNVTANSANVTANSANVTAAPATNVAATSGNVTANSANVTAAPTTNVAATSGNVTLTTNITATPPLIPNSNVTNLTIPVSRDNCGKTQLCAAQPSSCDPTNGTGCFFLGVTSENGQNFGFALSGESDGYIAAILSRSTTLGKSDTTYICANNNGLVKYFSALLNSGTLNLTSLNVNNVKGRVSGKKIQCTFDATVPDSSKSTSTTFALSVATGSYNATSDALGNPVSRITTNIVDLANVSASIINQLSSNTTNSTAAPTVTTTGNAVTIQQSLMQALLITVGVLTLAML